MHMDGKCHIHASCNDTSRDNTFPPVLLPTTKAIGVCVRCHCRALVWLRWCLQWKTIDFW